MRILRIIYEWPPPWSGLVPHPYELTKAQAKLGHEVSVFSGRWPKQGPLERIEHVKNLPFMGSMYPFREPLPGTMLVTVAPILFLRYLFYRSTHRNKTDIIHCHGSLGLWIYLYRFILSKVFPWAPELKTPLVAHFHITVAGREQALKDKGETPKLLSRFIDWPLAKLADSLMVKVSNACIFVNEKLMEEAVFYYNAPKFKCFVVESGVNEQLFRPVDIHEQEKTKKDLGLDPTDKLILNLGMMVERKNPHLLVEALAHLPLKYKLLLSGPFSETDREYEEKITKFIDTHGLDDRVIMAGYTPYPQTPIAYQAADVFVLPSTVEGTPKVVLESLACGIPTLASGFRLAEDISGLCYLPSLDPKVIAEQIVTLVEGGMFVDTQKVARIYSWEQRAKLVDQVYDFAKKN